VFFFVVVVVVGKFRLLPKTDELIGSRSDSTQESTLLTQPGQETS
jgi:hypothetical protein